MGRQRKHIFGSGLGAPKGSNITWLQIAVCIFLSGGVHFKPVLKVVISPKCLTYMIANTYSIIFSILAFPHTPWGWNIDCY